MPRYFWILSMLIFTSGCADEPLPEQPPFPCGPGEALAEGGVCIPLPDDQMDTGDNPCPEGFINANGDCRPEPDAGQEEDAVPDALVEEDVPMSDPEEPSRECIDRGVLHLLRNELEPFESCARNSLCNTLRFRAQTRRRAVYLKHLNVTGVSLMGGHGLNRFESCHLLWQGDIAATDEDGFDEHDRLTFNGIDLVIHPGDQNIASARVQCLVRGPAEPRLDERYAFIIEDLPGMVEAENEEREPLCEESIFIGYDDEGGLNGQHDYRLLVPFRGGGLTIRAHESIPRAQEVPAGDNRVEVARYITQAQEPGSRFTFEYVVFSDCREFGDDNTCLRPGSRSMVRSFWLQWRNPQNPDEWLETGGRFDEFIDAYTVDDESVVITADELEFRVLLDFATDPLPGQGLDLKITLLGFRASNHPTGFIVGSEDFPIEGDTPTHTVLPP